MAELEEELDGRKKKGRKNKNADNEFEEKQGGGLSTVFVTLAIIIIWLAVIVLLIKMDFGGFGSNILRPLLKDVPVISAILPDAPPEEAEEQKYPYATIAEAVEQIKKLELELQQVQEANSSDNDLVEELSAEIERLRKFEENQVEFEKKKTKFYEEVVFADNAPDITNYKEYYESIDPENAENLYKQVVQQIEYSAEVKEYAKAYSEMKPAQAAGVFEAMTDNLPLAALILENIDAAQRGKILGAMDPEIAARITKIMEP